MEEKLISAVAGYPAIFDITADVYRDINQKQYAWKRNSKDFELAGIFNILGMPVTQCPLGLSEEGLPLGVQVVTGKLQDRQSLAMALYLEKSFGGWRDPGAA